MAQKASDNALAIQSAGDTNIHVGLNYQDVRVMILDVCKAEFLPKLREEAKDIFEAGATTFLDTALRRFISSDPSRLQAFSDPDFQLLFVEAQANYARRQDSGTSDVTLDLLLDRAATKTDEDFKKVVLNAAVGTITKLTASQIDALTLAFVLTRTKALGVIGWEGLQRHIEKTISPFLEKASRRVAELSHLQYASCGALSSFGSNIFEKLRNDHPTAFSKGFSLETVQEAIGRDVPPGILVPSPFTEGLVDVPIIPDDIFKQFAVGLGLTESQAIQILDIRGKSLLSPEEVKTRISTWETGRKLIDYLDIIPINRFTLTSVGIAIAHANFRRGTGENPDLAIWL